MVRAAQGSRASESTAVNEGKKRESVRTRSDRSIPGTLEAQVEAVTQLGTPCYDFLQLPRGEERESSCRISPSCSRQLARSPSSCQRQSQLPKEHSKLSLIPASPSTAFVSPVPPHRTVISPVSLFLFAQSSKTLH